ncbi:hypothetical protein [Streptomyces chattanoogensis]|uniref:hypothetical protein n=1 Tax=Streptomyces chattanoogensis TaxID=66876 RepID=UPI003673ED3C
MIDAPALGHRRSTGTAGPPLPDRELRAAVGPRPWNVAAGIALVRERGGAVLGAGGRDFVFGSPVLVAGPAGPAREVLGRWGAPGGGGG